MLGNITYEDVKNVVTKEEYDRLQKVTVRYLANGSDVKALSPEEFSFMIAIVKKMRAAVK